jgi:hypothetical protein
MTEKDYNKVAKLENAIKAKYGDDAIKNPASEWDKDKEDDFISQIKEDAHVAKHGSESEKEYYNGFFVDKKLLSRESKRDCPVCEKYSFDSKDDVYLNKWQCCFECYVSWVEDREKRWKSGWRPSKEVKDVG